MRMAETEMIVDGLLLSFERKETVLRCFSNNSSFDVVNRTSLLIRIDSFRNLTFEESRQESANSDKKYLSTKNFNSSKMQRIILMVKRSIEGVQNLTDRLEKSIGDSLLKKICRIYMLDELDLFGVEEQVFTQYFRTNK